MTLCAVVCLQFSEASVVRHQLCPPPTPHPTPHPPRLPAPPGGDSGIGRAMAVHFAREGADVAIVYLDEHKDAEETVALVEKEGRKCLKFAGDVGKPEVSTGAATQQPA